jgi:transglutaminase-like putative cysteine protease
MRTVLRESQNMTIQERIGSIQKLVEKSVMDPEMRKLSLKITSHCPERDGMCEAKAIYKYVKKHMRYTGDIAPVKMSSGETEGIDLYQSARRTLELGAGDCDDGSILVSTLLATSGITPRLRVTAEDPNGEEGHIYPLAMLPKFAPTYAVALDTTLPGSNKFGVEMPAGRVTDYDA